MWLQALVPSNHAMGSREVKDALISLIISTTAPKNYRMKNPRVYESTSRASHSIEPIAEPLKL